MRTMMTMTMMMKTMMMRIIYGPTLHSTFWADSWALGPNLTRTHSFEDVMILCHDPLMMI